MIANVGIVVIGRNEGKRLIACLEALTATAVPVSQIVYVDSGSIDGSPETACRTGVTSIELTPDLPFCAARARNQGFQALMRICPELEYVQFLDGDCILSKSWIEKGLNFIQNRRDVAIVCGRRRENGPIRSLYIKLCDMEWDAPQGEVSACGGDFLVRANAFDRASGFNPELIAAEEPELCARLRASGWRIWRLPGEMTLHDAAISRFAQWWRRTVRSGFGYSQVAWIHRHSERTIDVRPLASAVFWGVVLPVAIVGGSAVNPLFACLALLYPVQVSRIAIGKGASDPGSWIFAIFMMIAKFAELSGILKFVVASVRRRPRFQFDYKH